jgi:hypothetical protein
MGNDDVMLHDCVETVAKFVQQHPSTYVISRSFVRFKQDVTHPLGVSRICSSDAVFRVHRNSAKLIFRSCGFIAGLVINKSWAESHATDIYDGSLYYQIYLGSLAFCETGIGYIAKPTVGGRSGNVPLFGAAASEKAVHIPGAYTPKGRARMWASVLRIAEDVGTRMGVDLVDEIRRELEVRQCFHVFEMYAGASRSILRAMRRELKELGLFGHLIPISLYLLDYMVGSRARPVYRLARKIMQ